VVVASGEFVETVIVLEVHVRVADEDVGVAHVRRRHGEADHPMGPWRDPPSMASHASAAKSSSRTIQWFCRVFASTIRSGVPTRSGGRSPASAGKARAQNTSRIFLMAFP